MSSSHSIKVAAIKEHLASIIEAAISDEIIEYVSTFSCVEDYDEFMENIVDVSKAEHVRHFNELKAILFAALPKKKSNAKKHEQQVEATASQSVSPTIPSSSAKGKKKFANLNILETNSELLRKGRHPCECQATRHELINNCVKCGRIVCEQEGSGPCLFCGNMVCTREQQLVISSQTKKANRLYTQLVEQKTSKEWKRAVESRNRLLDIDQMGANENKVIDDQNDYFDLNSKWSTEHEKAEWKTRMRSKYEYRHKTKRELKLALDFASRTACIEDNSNSNKKQLLKGVNKLLDSSERRFPRTLMDGEKSRLMNEIIQLMAESSLTHSSLENKKKTSTSAFLSTRSARFMAANEDFLQSIDQGLCLSMHQPWASLLVAGVKLHEGRTWKSDHRGRLWIAAAAKEVSDEDILACEEMYRIFYDDITFPKKYPTGCLLGCVFIQDCLDQCAYQEMYGERTESDSPYVFICSDPCVLPVFYSIQGQHKIFSLPKELHRTAKAALMS